MKTLLQKLHPTLGMACVFAMAFSACSEDPGLSGGENGANGEWPLKNVDPKQTWMTSETVQIDISIEEEADITAQTIMNENVTILGQKHLKGSDVMFLDVPQGIGGSFGLVYDDGVSPKQYRQINLVGDQEKIIDVKFQSDTNTRGDAPAIQKASTRAATPGSSLYGTSSLPIYGYLNFGPWGWGDVQKALVESQSAKNNTTSLIDYEIKTGALVAGGEYTADDDILLSFLYGHTGQTEARTLGYYYRSAGTFSDIEFHDIAEVLTLDYYDGKAKVQYQLDGESTWYDANFDYKDEPSKPHNANLPARRGDDAYNTLNVYKHYRDRITAIRGITFNLSIPKGKVFGFYLRTNDPLNATQKKILENLGVSKSNMPQYMANYSCANMNLNTSKGNFRSAIAIYDNFTFMGLDDNLDGGDCDCNDVTFALSNTKGEKFIPNFTDETKNSELNQGTIKDHPEYINPPSQGEAKLQSWTLAFENDGMDNDFDFNDVVLKVTPNTTTHKAEVKLLATGAQRRTEVYFNNILLGEVHDLFGVDRKTMVNTTGNTATRDAVTIGSIDWPENSTMEEQRMNFSLKVYDDGDDKPDREFSMADLLNDRKSPQALCVAGDWQWPKERVNVYTAYPLIGKWGVNFNNSEYSNWYAQPKADAVVTPKE